MLLLVIDSFCSLRILLGAIFIVKLIYYAIYFPILLNQINFCIPCIITRNLMSLSLVFCPANYSFHDPFRDLCAGYNRL